MVEILKEIHWFVASISGNAWFTLGGKELKTMKVYPT